MKKIIALVCALGSLVLGFSGCGKSASAASTLSNSDTAPTKISFFLTNDVHGHVENMGLMGGIVNELRARDEYKNGSAGLVVIDSGDQFQGTLISNYDEGNTVFKIFNQIGYDAIIPGNHDYDFGPKGWLYDRVTPGLTSNNPREVIEDLSGMAKFPMLSANTYLKNSLKMTGTQNVIPVDDSCVAKDQTLSAPIDFVGAVHPAFLKPYTIIEKAGVRIALIGIDFHLTTSVTTGENVSDLCFRDEASTYLEVRKSLEGKADVFVLLMHNGDVQPSTFTATDIVKNINAGYPGAVDLVAAGHTHQTHNHLAGDVHVMQDGCNATEYGRVDLYVDPQTKKVIPEKTSSWAGLTVSATKCDSEKAAFACEQLSFPVQNDPAVDALVATASKDVAAIGKEKLATSNATISVTRVGESALGDVLSDALRKAAGTQIAFMNAGGIRTSIKKGDLLYENLFEVIPFGNLGVVMDALPWKNLKAILQRTISTDGEFGTLEESGLNINYASSNADATTQMYQTSELLHVELLDGTVLFDKATSVEVSADKTFSCVTLDYLADGGDSYDFAGVPVTKTLKIARDVIADGFSASNPPLVLQGVKDGRFVNTAK
jgi:5'-nucleotidase